MTSRKRLSLAYACALALWTPIASAELRGVQATRSGVLKFESNGYPTDETVARVRGEIDYQRAVQAYIHLVPAVAIMQWRNAHLGPLGGKTGDLVVYRTTDQKLPILTANDTTTYIITFADLSDTGGLLMYEAPPGPTAGGINDLWQRTVTDTGMVNSRQVLVRNGDGSVRLVFSPKKARRSGQRQLDRTNPQKGFLHISVFPPNQDFLRPLLEDGEHHGGELASVAAATGPSLHLAGPVASGAQRQLSD
jgi:hypothetical protein